MTRIAITRGVSPSVDRCELTHLAREKIDHERAVAQHRAYEECLADLGCHLVSLPGDPDLPDCVFVEDVAVVLDEVAVVTRPGAASRWGETEAVRAVLEPLRPIVAIREPGMLDGGDVLRVGHTLYVGRSTRTNHPGIEQLRHLLDPYPYEVRTVDFHSCLHLKSAVTAVGERLLLIQEQWVSPDLFSDLELIPVHTDEPHGGNALRVGETVVYSTGYERTQERMEARGLKVRAVDQSELAKAEGGVTCCSLIFDSEPRGAGRRQEGSE